jgi:hypothetical protein
MLGEEKERFLQKKSDAGEYQVRSEQKFCR